MVGKDITAIRLQWMRHVLLNKERIQNSYNVQRKFFNEEQIIHFNKNFFDNPEFKKPELDKLLGKKLAKTSKPSEGPLSQPVMELQP
jgi:hypothetical protein